MDNGRVWTMTATAVVLGLAGVVWLAPATHGQAVITRDGDGADRREVRRVEVLGGRGSSIGVSVRDVDAAALETPAAAPRGVVIDDVDSEGPAAKAGFKAGDIVVSFDGETVRSARQFARVVEETPAGRPVKAEVLRSGARVSLEVTPGSGRDMRFSMSDDDARVWPHGRVFDFRAMPDLRELERLPEMMDGLGLGGHIRLGVSVQGLTPQLAEYFGVKDGVLVSAVQDDSPASRAGLEAGDVITSVNGSAVDDASELRRLLRDAPQATVKVGVMRDRKAMTIDVTLDRQERTTGKRRWTA